MEQDIEVVMPTFLEFFDGGILNLDFSVQTYIKRKNLLWALYMLGNKLISGFLKKFDRVMQSYRLYHPHHKIEYVAQKAKESSV